MGFHHVAIATADTKATHAFYTDVMGFRLVKVIAGKTPTGGWAKHLFYETGGNGLIAFWDIHDDTVARDFDPAISTALGLPDWANHIAFHADTVAEVESIRQRWVSKGHDVAEVDHGWCTSIYTLDPNGIVVEFCVTTQAFTEVDVAEAQRMLDDPSPTLESPKHVAIFRAAKG